MSDPAAPVVVVTGATDGIGKATALALARAGARVVVHGRSRPRVEAAVASLAAAAPGAAFEAASFDLGSLASVRAGAADLLARFPRIAVLVNNAGIFATERVVTGDGFEASFAVNYVGPFVLTQLLLGALRGGTVVNVSSMAHTRGVIHDDVDLATGFSGYAAYAQSKLAQVMHALSLADRHPVDELRAFSVHPGVVATKLLRLGFGPVRGVSTEAGAQGTVRLVAAVLDGSPGWTRPIGATPAALADLPSGSYLSDGRVTPPATVARDRAQRDALWQLTERRLGS